MKCLRILKPPTAESIHRQHQVNHIYWLPTQPTAANSTTKYKSHLFSEMIHAISKVLIFAYIFVFVFSSVFGRPANFVSALRLAPVVKREGFVPFYSEIRVLYLNAGANDFEPKNQNWSIRFNFIQFEMGSSWVVKINRCGDAHKTQKLHTNTRIYIILWACGRACDVNLWSVNVRAIFFFVFFFASAILWWPHRKKTNKRYERAATSIFALDIGQTKWQTGRIERKWHAAEGTEIPTDKQSRSETKWFLWAFRCAFEQYPYEKMI